ncbi:MAG: hypothetical protein NC340_00135 [Ruminococcus flavefaciens]|nr:hypothetical protein [Ruminococcus flavefaciens]MCM1228519.1 hypothetical protein [Ruminococcus flavefaciens]
MKKPLTAILLAVMMSVGCVMADFAGTLSEITASDTEDVEYELPIEYDDMLFLRREGRENEIMLWGYGGTETNLVIPEKIEGYTVTGIADGIFDHNKSKGVCCGKCYTA